MTLRLALSYVSMSLLIGGGCTPRRGVEMPANQTDFVKAFPLSYAAATNPEIVTIERANYLAITGQGAPGGPQHLSSIAALYAVAADIQRGFRGTKNDFVVPPLEGQWWFDQDKPGAEVPPETWHWRLILRVPEPTTQDQLDGAKAKGAALARADRVEKVVLEKIEEGLSVQMLHIGPYDTEPQTVAKLFAFMKEGGMSVNGMHHEIYLTDIRTVHPSQARTILRYPVKRA